MDANALKKGYTGYKLTDEGRAALLAHITPMFPDVIAHHVTHEFGVYSDNLPPPASHVRVVAVANNDRVQAAVVKVNGTVTRAYGNSYYHITISVDRVAGGSPVESNKLLADVSQWVEIEPFNVGVTPEFFPF
jgi:hypothetical protein